MDWREEYNVGVEGIDEQHKKLVQTVSKLEESVTGPDINLQISETLKFLVSYTQQHFNDEEEIMKSTGYPNFEYHKRLHQKLVNEIKQILINIRNKKPVNANDLVEFLHDWLNDHILDEDLKIGKHIRFVRDLRT